MLNRHPCSSGLVFGLSSHIGIWVLFWLITYVFNLPDAAFIGCTAVLALLLGLFGCLVWRAKQCFLFALCASGSVAVLLVTEAIVFSDFGSCIIPYLDHAEWFAGLSYLIFGIFMAISLAAEWIIALMLWMIRRSKTTSQNAIKKGKTI